MGFIETDPKQIKTAVALGAVLLAAVGVTVARLKPAAPAAPAAAAKGQEAPGKAPAAGPGFAPDLTRNPFERPPSASRNTGVATDARQTNAGAQARPWIGELQTEPMPVGPLPGPDKPVATQPGTSADQQKTKPTFTLLATVRSAAGVCAVLRVGESDAKVVQVGDRLADGFKVARIEVARAVLTDGRDTVVAKRRTP